MVRLAALVPPQLRPLARMVRDVVRGPRRVPLDRILEAPDCRVAIEPARSTFLVERSAAAEARVRVRNLGSAVWSSTGRHPLTLIARWLSPKREPVEMPVARFPLPEPVGPGEAIEVSVTLTAPDFLGHFLVELDLEQTGGLSFHDHAQRSTLLEVQVTGRDTDDIDYHTVYATADLSRDYWTVVGPGTKEEFDRLAQVKLSQLREIGMTPDSRVLDVGCGTGQLAVSLEGFLSDQGCYFGTDIGREAVAFCKQRFRRPNFRFAQNDMTSIPVTGELFDFITFFSVFTHTYPDETVLLLAEAKRLLSPDGIVFGDVFTSPMVERCTGNRGAVELNREHFLRLVALAGLKAEVQASWGWQKYGRREVFKFSHR